MAGSIDVAFPTAVVQPTARSPYSVFESIPAGKGVLVAQREGMPPQMTPEQIKKMTPADWGKKIKEWEAQKRANPNNLNNFGKQILGMNTETSIKQLKLIGVTAKSPSAMKAALEPLDTIAVLTGVQSPASLGSNWEQKIAFMGRWVRSTTLNIDSATRGIQRVNQMYQQRVITATEARLRIVGYTLKLQTESAALTTFNTLAGQLNLKLAKTETRLALENLKLQVAQVKVTIDSTVKTASLNLDTIGKNVQAQAGSVQTAAVANMQQLDNLRLQGLNKVRAASPVPVPTNLQPNAKLEFDPKTGVALPLVPLRSGKFETKAATRARILEALPMLNNGTPPEVKSSATPGIGISASEAGKVAANERQGLTRSVGDLKAFAALSEQHFTAKFGASRAVIQKELNEIRNNVPVAIETKNLTAALKPAAEKIDEAKELADMQAYARTATNLKPEMKKFIADLTVKTKAQFEYCFGLALGDAGLKTAGTILQIRQLGREAMGGTGKSRALKGSNAVNAIANVLPSAELAALNNLYGQVARNEGFGVTVQTYYGAIDTQKVAANGLGLAKENYRQAVAALGQGQQQNAAAVLTYKNNIKRLRTDVETVQARIGSLDINDYRLTSARQSLSLAQKVGDINVQAAVINNKVATQAVRITGVTTENNTFMAALTTAVLGAQDYNVESLNLSFKQAPTAVVMTDKGLVVKQEVLYQAYRDVKAKAGAQASAIRYDTPAVLKLARDRTHADFAAGYAKAAEILLADPPTSESQSAVRIMRDGKYDAARTLAPANLFATPPTDYKIPDVKTRLISGSPVVPPYVAVDVKTKPPRKYTEREAEDLGASDEGSTDPQPRR